MQYYGAGEAYNEAGHNTWEGKKMTEREALGLTIKLWNWIGLTGERKRTWPGFQHGPDPMNRCFLCEYLYDEGAVEPNCLGCPLYGPWGEGGAMVPCYYGESGSKAPFSVYIYSETRSQRRQAAENIVTLCKQRLAKLGKSA